MGKKGKKGKQNVKGGAASSRQPRPRQRAPQHTLQEWEQELIQKGGQVFDSETGRWFQNTPSNRLQLARRLRDRSNAKTRSQFYNQLTGKNEQATAANLGAYSKALEQNIVQEFFDLEGYRNSDQFNEMSSMRRNAPTTAMIAELIEPQDDGSVFVHEPNHSTLRAALMGFQGSYVR